MLVNNDISIFNNVLPTPVHRVIYEKKFAHQELLIKRDDLIHPYISGNKWRKLAPWWQKVMSSDDRRAHGVTTGGGMWSNHVLAVAALCHIYNVPSQLYLRGKRRYANKLMQLMDSWNVQYQCLERQQYDRWIQHVHDLEADERFDGRLFIPPGGDDVCAVRSCRKIVEETLSEGYRPDCWLVSAGYGTTAQGLLEAIDYTCDVHVMMAMPYTSTLEDCRARLGQVKTQANVLFHLTPRDSMRDIGAELVKVVIDFHRSTDILLDPLYDGPLLQLCIGQQIELSAYNQPILYHSGGLYGWFGLLSMLESSCRVYIADALNQVFHPIGDE